MIKATLAEDETMAGRALDAPATRDVSLALLGRVTGLLLVVMALCAGFAELGVHSALVVEGDAAATAQRIVASEQLFRLGFVGYLVAFACDVPVSILFYVLLAPAGRTLSLIAASFRLVYAAVAGASLLSYFGAMVVLSDGASLSSFPPETRPALALLFLSLFKHGFSLALAFFGVHLLLLGVLLSRSTSFPRVFGGLMALAGLSYLTGTLSFFLAPALNARIAPFLALPEMTEIALALWLLVKGAKSVPANAGR